MSLFNKNRESERTIEEMLSSKEEIEGNSVIEEEIDQTLCESAQNTVGEPIKIAKNKTDLLNPMNCFGMSEEKTDKWLMCCIKVWYYVMSFMWFLVGALTFAPVIFISNNVNVIFNNKKKSLLCGFIIYTIFVSIIVFRIVTRTN